MTSQTEFLTSYECIKRSFRQTMQEVDIAFSHEESTCQLAAIAAYQRILKLIDETFQILVRLPDEIENIKNEWNDACIMIQKLKTTKSDIHYRLRVSLLLLTGKRIGGHTQDASQQISKQIVTVADCIARNLIKGAEKTEEFMAESTPYLISKINPAPADAPSVSSAVQTTVEVAKNVTNVAVGVTGSFAGIVGSASMEIGRYLAPHIQTQGANLLEKSFGYSSEEANSKMEGAMTIAAGAVEGVSIVYDGLETSVKILGNSLSNNSVKIIEHKYGPSVANTAADTFDTIGNTFNVSNNVHCITPKGMAKKMVVDDYEKDLREESHYVPAGVLHPDLTALKEKHI